MKAKFIIKETDMGGVSTPMSTLANTPGVGNATPAAVAATTGASQTSTDALGSGDKWGGDDIYDQNGKLKKKKSKKKKSKKVAESNMNPYDKIAAMMAKKMGVKPIYKKKDSKTNTVEQIKFEIETFDEYVVNEGTPEKTDALKNVLPKSVLKKLGIPFVYKQGPSGKNRVYIKGDINDAVEKIKAAGWEIAGQDDNNTIKKFLKGDEEIAIYADGKDLPRITLKPKEEKVVESISLKKLVSNSMEPYISL